MQTTSQRYFSDFLTKLIFVKAQRKILAFHPIIAPREMSLSHFRRHGAAEPSPYARLAIGGWPDIQYLPCIPSPTPYTIIRASSKEEKNRPNSHTTQMVSGGNASPAC
jgi:hypothetical protein